MAQAWSAAPEFITGSSRLAAAIERIAQQPRVALDTESNSFHRYPERICLLQVATPSQAYLIDPLALEDMASLGRVLADEAVEKVLHSADYDLRSLDREWGFRIRNLFDTSIAAAFIGMSRLGLANVLEELLGITIPKGKKLQRADWSRRPLSAQELAYAATDVRYLLKLREVLGDRLRELGRTEWVAEECARLSEVRYAAPDPRTAFLAIKGSRGLDGRGLAVLKALWAFREGEAQRLGRPLFRVIPDQALVYLAADPAVELTSVVGLGRFAHPPLVRGLRQALEEGASGPPVQRPTPTQPSRPWLTPEERARLNALKEWRARHGKRLALDPALLWPGASLERLAREPGNLGTELAAPEVRRWQHREFGESLQACLASMG